MDLEALGDVIREERERQGMTQAELGRRVGLSRPSISLLERGSTKFPKIATLEAVATALGLPPQALFERAGVTMPDAAAGQVRWLAEQLDKPNLRRLIAIGHALLQEQQGRPQKAGR